MTEQSTLVGLTTFNITCVGCIVPPACPLRLTVWFDKDVAAVVASVRVEVFDVASVMFTTAGLNPAVTPPCREVALRFTRPANPASVVIVIVYWSTTPGSTYLHTSS